MTWSVNASRDCSRNGYMVSEWLTRLSCFSIWSIGLTDDVIHGWGLDWWRNWLIGFTAWFMEDLVAWWLDWWVMTWLISRLATVPWYHCCIIHPALIVLLLMLLLCHNLNYCNSCWLPAACFRFVLALRVCLVCCRVTQIAADEVPVEVWLPYVSRDMRDETRVERLPVLRQWRGHHWQETRGGEMYYIRRTTAGVLQ